MQAQVVLREVTRAAANLVKLREVAGFYGHARANPRLVALGSNQLEQNLMAPACAAIDE